MDDLTAMQSFRAERDVVPAEAREAIWRALEARMDAAAAEARAFGEAVAGSTAAAGSASRRRSLLSRRRRPLAFAGAAVAAAVAAGVLVLSSGPTAQPASAAEILYEAASAAGASDAPTTIVPGPGQFLYREEQRLEIHGWRHPLPPENSDIPDGGIGMTLSGPHAYNALVPVTIESWTDSRGGGRHRETLGTLQFWSKEEETRWKAAGSPLPAPFDPEYQQRYKATAYPDALELNSKVVDTEGKGWGNFNFPDTSKVPTEARTLRQKAEANELEYTGFNHVGGKTPKQLDPQETKEELLNVLQEGFPAPALQGAIFGALAELPNVKVVPDVTDGAGRQGDAIEGRIEGGVQSQAIFDPGSGEFLGWRGVLVDPAASPTYGGIPAGTVISERDFLESATVDSTQETGGEAG